MTARFRADLSLIRRSPAQEAFNPARLGVSSWLRTDPPGGPSLAERPDIEDPDAAFRLEAGVTEPSVRRRGTILAAGSRTSQFLRRGHRSTETNDCRPTLPVSDGLTHRR